MAIKLYKDSPIRDDFQSFRDPDTGLLKSSLQLDTAAPLQAIQALQQRTLTPGASPWAQLALQEQELMDLQAKEAAQKQVQAQQAEALRAGSPAQRQASALQGIRSAIQAEAGTQDQQRDLRNQLAGLQEKQRFADLSALPSLQVQATDPQRFNIEMALGEKRLEDAAKLKEYQEAMKAYAASKQARAITASSKK